MTLFSRPEGVTVSGEVCKTNFVKWLPSIYPQLGRVQRHLTYSPCSETRAAIASFYLIPVRNVNTSHLFGQKKVEQRDSIHSHFKNAVGVIDFQLLLARLYFIGAGATELGPLPAERQFASLLNGANLSSIGYVNAASSLHELRATSYP